MALETLNFCYGKGLVLDIFVNGNEEIKEIQQR